MINLIKNTAKNVLTLIGLWFVIYTALHIPQYIPKFQAVSYKKVKQLAKNVHPVVHLDGSRYCSSSTVRYNGKNYTLTNMHCCEDSPFYDSLRIANRIEKILYISNLADVCVLTSSDRIKGLPIATNELELLDPVLLLGYPRGEDLTPRFGYVIKLNYLTEVNYDYYSLTRESHFISTLTFPGNSGSPIFNSQGKVSGLLYAGPPPAYQYGVIVPLRFVKHALKEASRIK